MNIKALLDIFKMADLPNRWLTNHLMPMSSKILLAKTVCKSDDYVDELFPKLFLNQLL